LGAMSKLHYEEVEMLAGERIVHEKVRERVQSCLRL
jgi:hypothetical protein